MGVYEDERGTQHFCNHAGQAGAICARCGDAIRPSQRAKERQRSRSTRQLVVAVACMAGCGVLVTCLVMISARVGDGASVETGVAASDSDHGEEEPQSASDPDPSQVAPLAPDLAPMPDASQMPTMAADPREEIIGYENTALALLRLENTSPVSVTFPQSRDAYREGRDAFGDRYIKMRATLRNPCYVHTIRVGTVPYVSSIVIDGMALQIHDMAVQDVGSVLSMEIKPHAERELCLSFESWMPIDSLLRHVAQGKVTLMLSWEDEMALEEEWAFGEDAQLLLR